MKKANKYVEPVDENGKTINVFVGLPNFEGLMRIAKKRTHHIGLETMSIFDPIDLKSALAYAYIQGMNDVVISQSANEV